MLSEKIINIIDKNDITITESGENEYLLEWYSNAGEDMCEYVEGENDEDFVYHFFKLADNFDADDHAEMWVSERRKNGVPFNIRELIDDADDIQKFMDDVYRQLENAIKGNSDGETDQAILDKLSEVESMLYYHKDKDTNPEIENVAKIIKDATKIWHEITGLTIS